MDVADADVKGRRYFGKDLQVQEGVALDDRGLILLEIAREGGAADDIGAALVINKVGKVGGALHDQALADGERHQGSILADHKEVYEVVLGTGLLHKVEVTVCDAGSP